MDVLNHEVHFLDETTEWIVFLHGAGGSIATWKHQIEAFKQHYNMLAVDLRDHGLSKNIEPSYERYNFDIIVSDVQKVLDNENVKEAHFVTLSFGSVLMQAIYESHPHLVRSMTLIGGIFNANWMIKAFVHSARLLNLFLSYRMMYQVFSYLLMPKKNHQTSRRVYQMQARKLTQSEYLKWLGLYSEFFLLLRNFNDQSITRPTLVIMGSEDYLFLPSAKDFVSNHKTVSLITIEGAGHICNIEKPTEVNQKILNFLNNQPSQAKKQLTKVPI